MTRRVLVTRPEPGSAATARKLEVLGFTPVILPLTEIVPVAPAQLPDPTRYDAVTLTSVNAVRHAPPELFAGMLHKPVFAVGDATAAAASQMGFETVHSAAGTAIDLVKMIAAALAPGAVLLHPVGVMRTEGFAEGLAASGFTLDVMEIYRADRIVYSTPFLSQLFGEDEIWGALALSERAGTLLADLAARHNFRQLFDKSLFLCISEKAAAPLRALGRGKIVVSAEPTEEGVIRLLSSQA